MIAIDLGSNSLRVLGYDCQREEAFFSFEKMVKTADGLSSSGRIDAQAVRRVVVAIQEAQKELDFSSHQLRAVTTQALRQASNASEVLATIFQETGVLFEVISGEEEALLTLNAVSFRLQKLHSPCDSFVLVDIGGGSTELSFVYKDETIIQSFPLGIVTLSQSYETLDAMCQALPEKMKPIENFIESLYRKHTKPASFVATAGTPTTLAAIQLGMSYAQYDATKINGTVLKKEMLRASLHRLLAMSQEERAYHVGTGREALIMAGICIYEALFESLGFSSCMVIDDGLREGVALAMC